MEKADEIVDALIALEGSEDKDSIYDRAHELKGMAANFGMVQLSETAKLIEKAANDEQMDAAFEHIKTLLITMDWSP